MLIGAGVALLLGAIVIVFAVVKGNFNLKDDKGIIIVFLSVFIFIGMICGLFFTNSSDKLMDSFGNDKAAAYTVAQNIVEEQLKAPSTAEFCSIKEASITCEDDVWTVTGWVDAENSFGVMLRNEYTVRFKFKSSGRYIIEYCEID